MVNCPPASVDSPSFFPNIELYKSLKLGFMPISFDLHLAFYHRQSNCLCYFALVIKHHGGGNLERKALVWRLQVQEVGVHDCSAGMAPEQ